MLAIRTLMLGLKLFVTMYIVIIIGTSVIKLTKLFHYSLCTSVSIDTTKFIAKTLILLNLITSLNVTFRIFDRILIVNVVNM